MSRPIYRISAWVMGILLALAAGFMLPAAASAAPAVNDCTTPVVDLTNDHVLDQSQVAQAVEKLSASSGADVYVRAFQTTPSGSLDAYYRNTYTACSNWLSPDGTTPKANLIVLTFGMDRNSAIFYGSNFHKLDSSIDSIRSNQMNAQFKSGNFTKGITSSIDKIGSVLDGTAAQSSGPSTNVNWKIVGIVVGSITGGIALIFVLFVGGRTLVENKRERDIAEAKRQAKRADAIEQQNVAFTKVMSVDTDTLENNFLLTNTNVNTGAAELYKNKFDTLLDTIKTASGDYTELTRQVDSDPNVQNLSTERYDELQRSYKAIAGTIASNISDIEDLFEQINQHKEALKPENRKRTIEAIRVRLGEAQATINQATDRLNVIVEQRKLKHHAETLDAASAALTVTDIDEQHAQCNAIALISDGVDSFINNEAEIVQSALIALDNLSADIDGAIESALNKLDMLRHVDGEEVRDTINDVIAPHARQFAADGISSTLNAEQILVAIRQQLNAIEDSVADVVAEDAKIQRDIDQEEERIRKEKRRKQQEEDEERRRRNRNSSSGGSAFGGGIVGGYLGSSMGRSSGGSSSFGGGSSGSWGGGGGFGGGSSGSW